MGIQSPARLQAMQQFEGRSASTTSPSHRAESSVRPRGFIRERSGPRGTAFELRVYAGRDELTGKERRITRTVRGTKDDAERALRKLLDQLDDGTPRGSDATFGQLLDEWQKLKARRWSPKTALETRGIVRRHLEPMRPTPLRKITTRALDAFYVDLLADYQTSTVQRIQGVVRAALEQAVRWEWIARNPAVNCEPISSVQVEPSPPKPADIIRLLAQLIAHEGDLALFVRLAAVTGRRRGELCALRWTDVAGDYTTITAARTLCASIGQGWVERPISKNTKRFPPLAVDAGTAALLRAHRTTCAERLLALGVPLADNEYVFVRLSRDRKHTRPWSPDRVSHLFAAARAKVGLDKVRLHDLRHYVATTLLDEGYATPTVAGRLGQSGGGRTTHEVYAHFMPSSDNKAAHFLGSLLDGQPDQDHVEGGGGRAG